MTKQEQVKILSQGVAQLLPIEAFKSKLEKKSTLCIKLGVDPTSPDLHLGHAIVLGKMRQFQDLGHRIIFLIGDFTARIGDPTGKSKTRPPLTDDQILHNTQTYFDQVQRILDPAKMTVRYNSEWLSKLDFIQLVKLCAKVTVSQIIEREDFAKRLDQHQAVYLHEMLYPLMQGYDSVALEADVELGGTDQTFNLLMGRHLQELYGQDAQVILTMPILLGLDGVHKMSKSLNNAIGLTDHPDQAYGKLMSISDELMWHYYQMILNYDDAQMVAAQQLHPMVAKKQLAYQVVIKYWSIKDADQAQDTFEKLFQAKDYSAAQEVVLSAETASSIWVVDLLRLLGEKLSSSEVRRLVESGAIKVDGESVVDFKAIINWRPGMTIKVGKHRIYQIK